MSENLSIWNKFSQPPKTALKEIKAGRLKGKHDINPQWRYKAMTEAFGPIGIGWKYAIDRMWTEQGANNEVLVFVQISLYVFDEVKWSEPIPGIGGSTLIAKEQNGMYNSDEAYKMATTDALGVAMKMLGVAADIYMGLFDGNKYASQPNGSKPAESVQLPQSSDKGKVAQKSPERAELVKAFSASFNAVPQERKGETMTITGNSTDDDIRKATAHNIKLMEGAK